MSTTGKIHITDHHGEPVEGAYIAFRIDLIDSQYTAFIGETAISYPYSTEYDCIEALKERFGGDVIVTIDDL